MVGYLVSSTLKFFSVFKASVIASRSLRSLDQIFAEKQMYRLFLLRRTKSPSLNLLFSAVSSMIADEMILARVFILYVCFREAMLKSPWLPIGYGIIHGY